MIMYQPHSFLYTGGSFTAIDVPGAGYTYVTGINDLGQVVGWFVYAEGGRHAFLDTGGSFTIIDVPGASDTYAYGINDNGEIVGYYSRFGTSLDYGFLDTNGSLNTFNVPGALWTHANGINDSGQIVGEFADAQSIGHGFLATPVPEPRSLLVLAGCLISLVALARHRREA